MADDNPGVITILAVGDVVGKSGRAVLHAWLPRLRRELNADFIIVNGENASGGIGLSKAGAEEIFAAGADVITSGNHIWKFKEIYPLLWNDSRLLRPHNYPEGAPGQGHTRITLANGKRLGVLNLQGRVFMGLVECPFRSADKLLQTMPLVRDVDAWIVDFHAEATSEKMAMAAYLDGRVSAVVGTHTHVPTNDCRILAKGTGAITDLGMTGCYDSVIGMKTDTVLPGVLSGLPSRFEPAEGPATLCGTVIQVQRATGLCRTIAPIRRGGILSETS